MSLIKNLQRHSPLSITPANPVSTLSSKSRLNKLIKLIGIGILLAATQSSKHLFCTAQKISPVPSNSLSSLFNAFFSTEPPGFIQLEEINCYNAARYIQQCQTSQECYTSSDLLYNIPLVCHEIEAQYKYYFDFADDMFERGSLLAAENAMKKLSSSALERSKYVIESAMRGTIVNMKKFDHTNSLAKKDHKIIQDAFEDVYSNRMKKKHHTPKDFLRLGFYFKYKSEPHKAVAWLTKAVEEAKKASSSPTANEVLVLSREELFNLLKEGYINADECTRLRCSERGWFDLWKPCEWGECRDLPAE